MMFKKCVKCNKIRNNRCARCRKNHRKHLWDIKNKEHRQNYKKYYYNTEKLFKPLVINHYGGKCSCCGVSLLSFLTIDHINNNGNIFRKEHNLPGGVRFYKWIVKNNYPNDLQVLCWSCNSSKAMNKGICAHVNT